MSELNLIDIAVAFIIVVSVLYFSYKGLVMAVFDFFSMIISIALSYFFYPKLTALLSGQDAVVSSVKGAVSNALGLQQLGESVTRSAEVSLISNAPLPGFIKTILLENNNAQTYRTLAVDNINDYISGYLANLVIAAASFLLMFLLVSVAMKLVAVILDIASKLPVINTLNKLGGVAVGIVIGILAVYLLLTVLSVSVTLSGDGLLLEMLEDSRLADFFYNNNPLIRMINNLL